MTTSAQTAVHNAADAAFNAREFNADPRSWRDSAICSLDEDGYKGRSDLLAKALSEADEAWNQCRVEAGVHTR